MLSINHSSWLGAFDFNQLHQLSVSGGGSQSHFVTAAWWVGQESLGAGECETRRGLERQTAPCGAWEPCGAWRGWVWMVFRSGSAGLQGTGLGWGRLGPGEQMTGGPPGN